MKRMFSTGRGAQFGNLDGLRVVEFAERVSGPLAGTLLADHGADVVHVETTHGGDRLRQEGPFKRGESLRWKATGRNKRSVAIDLTSDDGRELGQRLAAWADVVITNLPLPILQKWSLDPPSLLE